MSEETEGDARFRQSVQMLERVLEGEPLGVVSAKLGVSRSTVDRRVKHLALQLTRSVGVDGLKQEGTAFVERLRQRRTAVLEALERFEPAPRPSTRAARVLTREEVALGAMRVQARAPRPRHDLVLYHLSFATGLRPLEVARLEVRDYLDEAGDVRQASIVRDDVAINGRSRPLHFRHGALDRALAAYIDERLHGGHGVGRSGEWRGLDPRSRLMLDARGLPYPITAGPGEGQRHVCRPILDSYRRIFRLAAISGLSTQSARLTLMSRMYERGADEDQVGLVLGIADRSAVREQLPRPRPELSKVLEELA